METLEKVRRGNLEVNLHRKEERTHCSKGKGTLRRQEGRAPRRQEEETHRQQEGSLRRQGVVRHWHRQGEGVPRNQEEGGLRR